MISLQACFQMQHFVLSYYVDFQKIEFIAVEQNFPHRLNSSKQNQSIFDLSVLRFLSAHAIVFSFTNKSSIRTRYSQKFMSLKQTNRTKCHKFRTCESDFIHRKMRRKKMMKNVLHSMRVHEHRTTSRLYNCKSRYLQPLFDH